MERMMNVPGTVSRPKSCFVPSSTKVTKLFAWLTAKRAWPRPFAIAPFSLLRSSASVSVA